MSYQYGPRYSPGRPYSQTPVQTMQPMQNVGMHAQYRPYPYQTQQPYMPPTGYTDSATWLWCIVMAFSTGCYCIPFFMDNCKDKVYTCSSCNQILGINEAK
jgi:hypothetical protein